MSRDHERRAPSRELLSRLSSSNEAERQCSGVVRRYLLAWSKSLFDVNSADSPFDVRPAVPCTTQAYRPLPPTASVFQPTSIGGIEIILQTVIASTFRIYG